MFTLCRHQLQPPFPRPISFRPRPLLLPLFSQVSPSHCITCRSLDLAAQVCGANQRLLPGSESCECDAAVSRSSPRWRRGPSDTWNGESSAGW